VCLRHADAPRCALFAAFEPLFRPLDEAPRRSRSRHFGSSRHTSSRSDPASFTYAQLYESAASGAYERHVAEEAIRKERQLSEELDRCWTTYRTKLVELFDERTSAEESAKLEAEVLETLKRERPDIQGKIVSIVLRGRLHELKCDQMNALSEGEFRSHRSLRALRDALIERHAVDLLAPPSEGTEGEGALPAA
jgi:hypothetical protein